MGEDKLLQRIITESVQSVLKETLPEVIASLIGSKTIVVSQEFIAIEEACTRYKLSRRTLYNYHYKRYITLCSTEGKTYVSLFELERFIASRPLPRSQS